MSNCFNCSIESYFNQATTFITRGDFYMRFMQKLETVMSVVDYPNEDSAHSNGFTNNYVTYRVNGFRYKAHMCDDTPNNGTQVYIVFFKVKILTGTTLNITQLRNNGDFSDFILYKQPNDVIDYYCVNLTHAHDLSTHHVKNVDVSCNKTFFVKPDEVFGIYYLVFTPAQRSHLSIDASISVYFDVV